MRNIVLVGFMGTGKTEVSKILASRLKIQRLCTDDMIEWKVGKPITRIFSEDGEAFFRKVESEVVAAVSRNKGVVIDAGGGVVINDMNVTRLKETGTLFCLTARPDIILSRTSAYANRPLLNTDDQLSSIKELLQKRSRCYKSADYAIDTSDITQEEAADKIEVIMKEAASKKRPHLIFS